MSTKIKAGTSTTGAVVDADTTGILELQSGSTPTTAVTIDASQNVGIGTASPTKRLQVTSVANTNAEIRIQANASNDYSSIVLFGDNVDDSGAIQYSNYDDHMQFDTNSTERMRINSSGNIFIANTSTQIGGDTARFTISGAHNSGYFGIAVNSTTTSGNQNFINFGRGGSQCGYIYSGGTNSTGYLTSSDYRLKENIAPMTGALAKVNALKPVTYKWKTDGTDSQGFIAHELAEVCPEAVAGSKDEVDAHGNPRYQGVDTSFLVATLTAAIQEQQALIENLTTRLAVLEGAK